MSYYTLLVRNSLLILLILLFQHESKQKVEAQQGDRVTVRAESADSHARTFTVPQSTLIYTTYVLVVTAPPGKNIFLSISPEWDIERCVDYFAGIYEEDWQLRPASSRFIKPSFKKFCLNPEGTMNGQEQARRFYRSHSNVVSIVYYKEHERGELSVSYRIDDCFCRNGPNCTAPCVCEYRRAGRDCATKTCLTPAVQNSRIVLDPTSGLQENNMFTVGTVIHVKCFKGYRLKGNSRLQCRDTPGGFGVSPKCLLEDQYYVRTCPNRYDFPHYHGHLPVRTTVLPYNRVEAGYHPYRERYSIGTRLKFKCPHGTFVEKSYQISVLELTCRDTGQWSMPWPKCKGITCPFPKEFLPYGELRNVKTHKIISDRQELVVGTEVEFLCDRDSYLIGNERLTCKKYAYWGKQVPECVTLLEFKNRCLRKNKLLRFKDNDRGKQMQPYCSSEAAMDLQGNGLKISTLTVATAAAATVFGVLLLVVAIIAYQRRRIMRQIRRARREEQEEEHRRYEQQMSTMQAAQRSNNTTFNFFLPSYDEAIGARGANTLPPTFDEAMSTQMQAPGEMPPLLPPPPPISSMDGHLLPSLVAQGVLMSDVLEGAVLVSDVVEGGQAKDEDGNPVFGFQSGADESVFVGDDVGVDVVCRQSNNQNNTPLSETRQMSVSSGDSMLIGGDSERTNLIL